MINRNDFKPSSAHVLNKRQVFLLQAVRLRAGFACIDVAGVKFRLSGFGIQTTADHGTQIAVDDVKMRIEVHLHLPAFMVMYHHDRVMSESVRFHDLTDSLFVGTHTAADKRYRSCRNIIASFKPSVSFDSQHRRQS